MNYINCALCQTDETVPYRQEGGYQAVQCKYCRLVYVNPRPGIGEMKELYEGQETQVDIYAHLSQSDKKRIEARKCLKFIQRYRSGGRLLEIGSAAGYFLSEARDAGFEVQGLDLTNHFVKFSEEVLGVPAFEGTLKEAPFADGSFDIIYHRNVLSHLAYPVEEFAIMHRLLAPGGILIFETGNVAELPAEEAGILELPDHLYHFSEMAILKLLQKTNFLHLRTYRFMLISQLPFIRKIKQIFKRPALKSRSGCTPLSNLPCQVAPSSFIRRWVAYLAQFIRYGLGRMLPTEGYRCTLIVIAKKPFPQSF
jgi:SAM-dependent methyltransferase